MVRLRLGAWLLVGVVSTVASPAAKAQHLAVVSRGADALLVHDLATGSIVGSAAAGEFPHEVALHRGTRRAFVASYGGSTIHVIDMGTVETLRVLDFPGRSALHGVHVSRDGNLLWVTAEESGEVLEIDSRTGEQIRSWKTRGYRSHMLTSTPDDQKLYVANIDSGTVSVIHRARGTVDVLLTGAGTEGIDVAPDGGEVWASNRADNTISVINTETDRVVATVETSGDFGVKLRFSPDGREVWVANNRSGTITVFDTAKRTLLETIEVGARPLGIVFSYDGRRAYVSRPGANEIVEIDPGSHTIIRRIPTGASPDGMAWLP